MKKYLILLLIPLLLHSCGTASKISKADQPWSYETAKPTSPGPMRLKAWE